MIRKLSKILVLVGIGVSLSASALAQQNTVTQPDVKFKSLTIIEFSELKLDGNVVKPMTEYVNTRRKTTFTPMIEIRQSFVSELTSSMDDL